MSLKNAVWKRTGKNNSHIAEWLKTWITRREFDSRAKNFFSVLFRYLPLICFPKIFACDQTYPLEISTGNEVVECADDSIQVLYYQNLEDLANNSWAQINW